MGYNPQVLENVLRERALTAEELSERIGIKFRDLEEELSREPGPRQGILNSIAYELALPPYVFYMEEAPRLEDVIPDFRSERPQASAKSRETIESIQLAAGIQHAAAELGIQPAHILPRLVDKSLSVNTAEMFGSRFRKFFNISLVDQKSAKDAKQFYVLCRKQIEDKGICVLQESFPKEDGSGFCLTNKKFPIIVVNTRDQKRARRLFTLIHELAHVLIGQTGISDPFIRKNDVEKFCNRFAASFLAPEGYVKELLGTINRNPSPSEIARASRQLKISQQATALRLTQLGLIEKGSYAKWLRLVHNNNPDYGKDEGRSPNGPPPQEKVKLARYGFNFARTFGSLLDDDRISEINLYRLSGLKPKYQREYISYARSLSGVELHNLELDDE